MPSIPAHPIREPVPRSWLNPTRPSLMVVKFARRWPFATVVLLYCTWVIVWAVYSWDLFSDHRADMSLLR